MSNFIKQSEYRYIVFNQNDFNNVLYYYFEATDENKKNIRSMVQDYPKKYPCKIVIIDKTFELSKIYIDIEYGVRV